MIMLRKTYEHPSSTTYICYRKTTATSETRSWFFYIQMYVVFEECLLVFI